LTMSKLTSFVIRAVVCLFSAALPLAAQYASLVGTVKDQQGGAMPNVAVTLTSQDTGVSMSTKSDGEGNFEFPTVRPGPFRVRAEQPGFQTFVQNGVVLAVDDRLRVDPVMQVGETSTVLTVDVQATTVQTESSSLGSVVDTKKIVEMPLNGRF